MDNAERYYKKGDEIKAMTPYTVSLLGGSNSGWQEVSESDAKAIRKATEAVVNNGQTDAQSVTIPELSVAKVIALNSTRTGTDEANGSYIPGVDTPPQDLADWKKDNGPIVGGPQNTIGISGATGIAAVDSPAPADSQSNTIHQPVAENGDTVQPENVETPQTQAEQLAEQVDRAKQIVGETVTAETVQAQKRDKKNTDKVTAIDNGNTDAGKA